MNILFASAEVRPYAKTGGLADVGASLPSALQHAGVAISTVMPLYGFMHETFKTTPEFTRSLRVAWFAFEARFYRHGALYMVEAPLLGETEALYGNEHGDYPNNDLRFAIFAEAVIALAEHLGSDLIHCNDWHTGLIPFWLKVRALSIRSVFTIHSLAYQGLFEASSLYRLGIDPNYFHHEALEFYGRLSFMKAGLGFADAITTVSPSYAQEILTPQFGCGLEGFLIRHSAKLHGILNGIETDFFDPATDPAIALRYRTHDPLTRRHNKEAILQEARLHDADRPLIAMIGRPVAQKGFDLLLSSMEGLLSRPINLLVMTGCESEYCAGLAYWSERHDNFTFCVGYDEEKSHRIYAGCDFLLMPSRFEPCGLNQMIAMRYGAIPIVHAVGGLRDTVHEETPLRCGAGVRFNAPTSDALVGGVDRALALSQTQRDEIISFNMSCDFSFKKSAQTYINLYRNVLSKE
ncbi:MAG: glycogen synthase [Campylobacterales bacterium]|nr:glycogen synthase [Campylobacterales bacterium]